MLLWKRRGASLPGGLKEKGTALVWKRGEGHLNSVGSGSEADGSDASVENEAGMGANPSERGGAAAGI